MKTKQYALVNMSTKATATITSTSFEAALKEWTGCEVGKPSAIHSRIRYYNVPGALVLACLA
jgi:hypothetical protein